MALTQNKEHQAKALALLPTQFRESTDLQGVIGALALEVQALEDALFPVAAFVRSPTSTTSADLLRKLVGAPVNTSGNQPSWNAAQIDCNVGFGTNAFFERLIAISLGLLGSVRIADGESETVGDYKATGGKLAVVLCPTTYADSKMPLALRDVQDALLFVRSAVPATVRPIILAAINMAPAATFFLDSSTLDGFASLISAVDRST